MIRRPIFGDLVQLARMLLAQPPRVRRHVLDRAFFETAAAECHRRASGLRHPQFGDGSLAGWASAHKRAAEPGLDDPEYLDCLILVLTRLRERTSRYPEAQDTQRSAVRSNSSRPRGISSPQSSHSP